MDVVSPSVASFADSVLINCPFDKEIYRLVGEAKYGIHDISRIELTAGLPRFNMPLEVGLDFGAKAFGTSAQPLPSFVSTFSTLARFCLDCAKRIALTTMTSSSSSILRWRLAG